MKFLQTLKQRVATKQAEAWTDYRELLEHGIKAGDRDLTPDQLSELQDVLDELKIGPSQLERDADAIIEESQWRAAAAGANAANNAMLEAQARLAEHDDSYAAQIRNARAPLEAVPVELRNAGMQIEYEKRVQPLQARKIEARIPFEQAVNNAVGRVSAVTRAAAELARIHRDNPKLFPSSPVTAPAPIVGQPERVVQR